MKEIGALIFVFGVLLGAVCFAASEPLRVYPGYLTRVRCEGRLLVSAIGNDHLIKLEALPSSLGCGVLVKPLLLSGRTNLVLETSTGTIERIIEVVTGKVRPLASDLEVSVKGGAK